MNDFLADDLMASEIMAGRTKRKTKYRIKRRRKMRQRTKSLRKRQTNLSQRRRQRKLYKKRMRTDMNFKKNRKDYRKQYYKKHKKGSTGYTLPFELEFLYEGKPAYLMSLSEMFDAVNIYVEGETAMVVDLNDFLARTEWYLEEDIELFQDLIRESYAVLDEDPQDAWSEFTLDERDPPAKRHIDKSASMRDLKLIYREGSELDEDEVEEFGPNAFSKYYYHMPLSKDFFYHYTYANRVDDIIADGYLRPNFIMDDDAPGGGGVFAISGVWGWDVYSVQMSGGKKSRAKEMVALKFKTDTKPKKGFVEEVYWDKPVKLKDVEVVSVAQARRDLIGRKERFEREAGNHSEMIVFYDAREAMKAKAELIKYNKRASICDRTDNQSLLQMLLAVLRAAHFAHWTSHWQVKGQSFYGDHQIMDRIYNTLIEEIDTLAEKIVGTYGASAVNAVEQAQLMANHLLPLAEAHAMNDPIRRALLIEEGLQVVFKNTYDMLKEQGGLTLGMDDFIMSMANTHESNLYLLRQRCAGQRFRSASMTREAAGKPMLPGIRSSTAYHDGRSMGGTSSCMLYLIGETENKSKFYEMVISGTNVEVLYGRLGSSGRRADRSFSDILEAERFFTKQLSSKLKKGYVSAFSAKGEHRKSGPLYGKYPIGLTSNPGPWQNQDIAYSQAVITDTISVVRAAIASFQDDGIVDEGAISMLMSTQRSLSTNRDQLSQECANDIRLALDRIQGTGRAGRQSPEVRTRTAIKGLQKLMRKLEGAMAGGHRRASR